MKQSLHTECFTLVQIGIKTSDENPCQPHLIHKTLSKFQYKNINKKNSDSPYTYSSQ
jgi:hypothetical protein